MNQLMVPLVQPQDEFGRMQLRSKHIWESEDMRVGETMTPTLQSGICLSLMVGKNGFVLVNYPRILVGMMRKGQVM